MTEHKLTVHQAKHDDVYTDIVRVHKNDRDGIPEGKICKVSIIGGVSAFFAIRGLPDSDKGKIRLDEVGRDKLNLKEGASPDFTFTKATYFEAICWAAEASDPAARIATWIAIWFGGIGAVLGVAGLALAAWGLWIAPSPCH